VAAAVGAVAIVCAVATGGLCGLGAAAVVGAVGGEALPALEEEQTAAETAASVVESPTLEDIARQEGVCEDAVQRISRTLQNIRNDTLPYGKDGTIFQNRQNLLPEEPLGYYKEYTVDNSSVTGRGVERLVTGANGDLWYTPDHYKTFIKIWP
jgi:guanyl-specific ribonuclease Sa